MRTIDLNGTRFVPFTNIDKTLNVPHFLLNSCYYELVLYKYAKLL